MAGLDDLVGESAAISDLRRRIHGFLGRQHRHARLLPILILGETGTGKSVLARMIHRAGPRAQGPFVELDCTTLKEQLLEDQLFGHERHAFTEAGPPRSGLFQAANRGTLFLDEIGVLPLALQAKFLKAIDEGVVRRLGSTKTETVDVAIVAATNEDLRTAVQEGRFRRDLYERLAVFTVALPPLRERITDVDILAERFLAQACADQGVPQKSLSPAAVQALRTYAWPGNVRELRNAIERAAVFADDSTVSAEALALPSAEPQSEGADTSGRPRPSERDELIAALTHTSWNITQTATRLGITRNTVRARIKLYDLRRAESAETAEAAPPTSSRPDAPATPPRAFDAELADHGSAGGRSAVPSSGVRWERRRVALLRIAFRGGSDTALALTAPIIEDFVSRLQGFGGRVEGLSLRGLIAVFGLEPDEDAPRQAANAALALVKGFERERAAEPASERVFVAAAIHVNPVLIGHLGAEIVVDEEARRDAVRQLDKLEAAAANGEIALSDAAATLLEGHFEVARNARADGVAAHLVGRAPLDARFAATAFVGREREVGLLHGLLEQALDGRGQIVTIIGEPGIGKSRLLHEFAQSLTPDTVGILRGQCAAHGASVPYFLVLDVVRRLCGLDDTDGPDAVESKVRLVLDRRGVGASAWVPTVLSLLRPLSERAPAVDLSHAHTFEALQQLLLLEEERRPLLMIIDDLHWIDRTSGELLAALAELVPGKRLLVVGTMRTGFQAPWGSRAQPTQIVLAPLTSAESRRLVTEALGERTVADDVLAAILARAEGHPLFLHELVRALAEDDGLGGARVPETVFGVVGTRIGRLAPAVREVLQTAAVIGRDVPLALLDAASDMPPERVREGLTRLQAEEFLYATRLGANPEYTFNHALTWDVAYESIVEGTRGTLHGRVLAAMERCYPNGLDDQAEVLAEHARQARLWDKSARYARQAGQKAFARSAHREAVGYFDSALAAASRLRAGEATTQLTIDMHLEIRGALAALGEHARAFEHLREAEALATQLADEERLGRVCAYLTSYYRQTGDRARALEAGERALAIAERRDDLTLRVSAGIYLGHVYYDLGRYRRAAEMFRTVVAAVGDDHRNDRFGLPYIVSVHARALLAICLAELGEFDEATRHAEEADAIARSADHPTSIVSACMGLGRARLRAGDIPRAMTVLEDGVALARARSIQLLLPSVAEPLGLAYVRSGRIGEGLALLEEAAGRHSGTRGTAGHAARATSLSEGYRVAGRQADALREAKTAVELATKHDEQGHRAWALLALAEVSGGDEAAAAYREAVRLAEALELRPLLARGGISREARR